MAKRFTRPSAHFLFRLSNLVERTSAHAQGKGYGTSTIKQEVNLVHRVLGRRPRLAIDIGGNIGDYTAELLTKTPDLEIHMFEPSSTNIDKLKTRFSADNNVTLVPYAVSNSVGSATLFSDKPGSGLGSLIKRKLDHFGIEFDFSETVTTLRFEEYWNEQLHRRNIDIVKMDIEGHELAALQGFGEAIRATSVLQFEFGGCNIDTRTFFQDFWYFFDDNGFEIYRITPLGLESIERYRESDEFFATTNFIGANRQPIS
jgi:FkbM family methyltransferase